MTNETIPTTILMVLTNHADLGGVRPTGLFVSEASEPWEVFTDAGYRVEVASVTGGQAPLDGFDPEDAGQRAFLAAFDLNNTDSLADKTPSDYAAVVFPGGHGTMWDFPTAQVGDFITAAYGSGDVIAAVCHGPAALAHAQAPDGSPLVAGRTVSGFSNEEESAAGLTEVVPFLLQDRLTSLGGRYVSAPAFTEQISVDGRLITGQNPQSARAMAQAVVTTLNER